MTPLDRHRALCRDLARHDHLYYVANAPIISDREYDALFQELKQLERDHPELVHPGSPTQRIGEAPRTNVAKVAHVEPMYSLDNTYNEDEVREFDRRVREGLGGDACAYVVEPKIDGASLEVVYREGRLMLGVTRGDGRVGEDVTENVRTIRALPLDIEDQRPLTFRGEVVLFRRDLDAINERRAIRGEEPFANPRNAAAGSLRLLDSKETAARNLRVFLYDLVERHFETHTQVLDAIAQLGLPHHGRQRRCANLDEVLAYIHAFDRARSELPYETDGVVIKVDDLSQRTRLGSTARFPRWAIAFKYEAERAFTIVRAIETDLGRTGALTPVAVLDPVALSGTTVSRASLHNIDYVAEKDVRIGDTVTIEKAGEIIPQVIGVELDRRPEGTVAWTPPARCPACDTQVARIADEVALRCPNPRCPGRVKAGIFYFTRRSAMDVDHLGRALVEQLVGRGLLADVADIFALPERRAELLEVARLGAKSVDNLLRSIEDARKGRTLSRLLTGLGIPMVGSVAAQLIARRYPSLPQLLAVAPETLREELGQLRGIGPRIAESVTAYFSDPAQRAVMEKLLKLGVEAEEPKVSEVHEGPLGGASFCVTGTLSRPRDEVHDAIRAAGGTVHERVVKGTRYLVVGEKVGAKKIEAAEKRGTKPIDEAELERLIREGVPAV